MLLERFAQSNKFWKKSFKKIWTSKFEYSEGSVGNVLRTSWGHPELTSQGRPFNIRLGRPQDVRLGPPQDGQIGSLGDVLETLEGSSSGRPGDQYLPAAQPVQKRFKNVASTLVFTLCERLWNVNFGKFI